MIDEIEGAYYRAVGFPSPWFRRSVIKSFLKEISSTDIMDATEVIGEKRRVGWPYEREEPVGLICWKYFIGILKNKVRE